MNEVIVSVIIPIYNEEQHIAKCLESLEKQTYPKDRLECILVDGGSKDKTLEIIDSFAQRMPIKVFHNEKRLVTYALNIGVENAIGKYIVRFDAHSGYSPDYIEKCVYYLENTDADNVGGVAETKGEGFIGEINADILSSKFGVGNSSFRTEEKNGYVDTVPFGAYRREIFDKIGKFNPDLPRSEDNDFNSRIRESGGKVFLSTDIRFTYYCRNTVKGLLSQGIKNGNALFLTLKANPKAMSLRHYIPFLFVLSLIAMPIISIFLPFLWWAFAAEIFCYTVLNFYFSLFKGKKKYFFVKIFLYPLFHIVYGIGSLLGMLGIKLY